LEFPSGLPVSVGQAPASLKTRQAMAVALLAVGNCGDSALIVATKLSGRPHALAARPTSLVVFASGEERDCPVLEARQAGAYLILGRRLREDPMPDARKARAVGFNHVALEVGDIEEALAFYGRIFEFELRGKSEDMAFIDLGDQFLALQKGRRQPSDDGRHFGLVVDDKEAVRQALADAGVEVLPGSFLDFRDPWGNRVEIVGYQNIQFSKAPNVLRGMGLTHLAKSSGAIAELAKKGMAPS
jgi:lactoylglutathione lyase